MKLRALLFAVVFTFMWSIANHVFASEHAFAQHFGVIIESSSEEVLALKRMANLSLLEHQFDWEIQQGDWLDVNLTKNTMVIRRKDSSEYSQTYQIGSGLNQDENITWAGVTYNPRTPTDTWIIKEKNQQNMYWVFGTKEKDKNEQTISEQLFLRMYRNDSNGNLYRTKYGFHATPEIENIIDNEDGYGSYGCLLSRYQLLKFMEQIYDKQTSLGEEGLIIQTYWEHERDMT
jgi:hypothetical protein